MITAAGSQHCHAKGEPALTLTPFWRLTVSVNDDPESLLVLPLIREDLADKIMLFKIEHHDMPMPTSTKEERAAFWNRLMSELPHWLHRLTQWEIPDKLKANRFGVKHYHHPELMDAIEGLSPETKLYDLLKDRFAHRPEGWRGTASELETLLAGDTASTRYEARKIFTFNHACARYLERLSKKHPAIVMRDGREHDRHYWKIVFPQPIRVEVVPVPLRCIPAPPVIGPPGELFPQTNLGLVS
jgi:hypothetical protein